MICKKEKVGRSDWEALKVGETGIFELPDENAVEAARVAVSHLKKFKHMDFERITVNEPLMIAFKRLR